MPLLDWSNLVDTSNLIAGTDLPLWQNIRTASKELIERVAPNASVTPWFELEFDKNTLQRKVTPVLKGINSDADRFHSWMMGITSATIQKGADGESEFVGGYSFTWNLQLEFEGFFDKGGSDPYSIAEIETQAISVIFFRNRHRILDRVKFYEIDWTTLDLEAFADGNNLIVAQGGCRVDLEVSIPE